MSILKTAGINDIELLREICVKAYSLHFSHHWTPGGLDWYLDKEFGLKRLAADLTDPAITYHFICDTEMPIGFARIRTVPQAEYFLDNVIELEKIYMLPHLKTTASVRRH